MMPHHWVISSQHFVMWSETNYPVTQCHTQEKKNLSYAAALQDSTTFIHHASSQSYSATHSHSNRKWEL